jgi:hypothetical protein
MILWFVVIATGVARVIIVFGTKTARPLTLPEGQFAWRPCKAKSRVPWREYYPCAL